MLAMLGLRTFSLTEEPGMGGVSCTSQGVFVDDVPLLMNSTGRGASATWTVRPIAEINEELSARYRLPVDVTRKTGALTLIAHALNRGDLALAAIATVQMQFPDPPPLVKNAHAEQEVWGRARELHLSGLLKADWDPAEHPRTGAPPNAGHFATKPKEIVPFDAELGSTGWPLPHINRAAREFVKSFAGVVARSTGRVVLATLRRHLLVEIFVKVCTPTELNRGEELLTAQLKSGFEPPKTLEELKQPPTQNIRGYEQHHIVEQNPENIKKTGLEKFSRARIDDPSNLVWVPHFPHIEVTAEYNGIPDNDGGPILRERVKQLSFEEQRETGLRMLRKHGVLK